MKRLAIVLALLLALAGCGSGSGTQGDKAVAPPANVDIVFKDGKVMPQGKRVEVKVGQLVRLHVTSDRDDEVHVHSTPEHEYEIATGTKDKIFSFSIDTPGQVAVESHGLDVTILQLVVR